MPRTIKADGRTIVVPDDATDDEINQIVGPAPTPTPPVDTSNVAGAGPMGVPQPSAHPPVNMKPAIPGYDANPGPVTNFFKGALKSIPGTAAGIAKTVPGTSDAWEPAEQAATTNGRAQAIGKTAGNIAQYFIPAGAEEKAGLFAASKLPKLAEFAAPAARVLTGSLSSGAINKAQGGDFGTGAATGLFGGALGEGIRSVAPAFAESALGVRGNDKMYGRTVGRAILDDTRGIRPETVEQSARGTVSSLKPQMEQAAADAGAAGARGSLDPARAAVSGRIGSHTTNRAVGSAKELEPLQSFLDRDAVTGLPLSQNQSPTGLLQLKRGLDADFIGNWNPTRNTNNELDAAKQAYGKLADEFHAAAPGTQQFDQRISSLIPVIDRADRMSRAPGMLESTLHRFRTPTGALIGMGTGAAEGYREGGGKGALAGAALGAIAPSVLGSPATQMLFARTANKAPLLFAPAVGATNQLLRKK